MKKGLVSVIIPVYNDQEYLNRTLLSLKKQSYDDMEIIVVDDGSQIPIKVDDTNSKLIRQKNAGAPAARNRGVQDAKGEFIIWIDADTIAKKEMIQTMVAALRADDTASFCYANFYFGKVLMRAKPFSLKTLQKKNYIVSMSLVRAKDVIKWDESLHRFQDWDYFLTLAKAGKKGVWIDDILFTIEPKQHGMSTWIPRWAYWWPFCLLPQFRQQVREYNDAKRIIFKKHGL